MTDNPNTDAPEGNETGTDEGSADMFNTAAGWVLFAGVVGLGLSILSDKYFHAYSPEAEVEGYPIEVVEVAGEEEMSFEEALSLVSVADGERVFAKCASCHTVEQGGADGQGPNLFGVMGAAKGNSAGFSYSSALTGFGGEWGWNEMNDWLDSPRRYIGGTSMGFNGLSSIEDRAAVAVYMNSFGSNIAVPEFVPTVAEDEAEAVADETAEVEAEQNVAEATSEETAAAEAS